jgi:hypothetical protein
MQARAHVLNSCSGEGKGREVEYTKLLHKVNFLLNIKIFHLNTLYNFNTEIS